MSGKSWAALRGRRAVTRAAALRIEFAQPGVELQIAFRAVEARRDVVQRRHEVVPEFLAKRQHVRRVLHALLHLSSEAGILMGVRENPMTAKPGGSNSWHDRLYSAGTSLRPVKSAAGAEDDEGTPILGPLQERA